MAQPEPLVVDHDEPAFLRRGRQAQQQRQQREQEGQASRSHAQSPMM